ncbi:hypothetical protein [Xanthobacter variabilis]|uniref:hypothetical protein n=1 Tax=Xanthobacter variabilis TaxID=3119932 RepID=UPI003726B78A
MLERKTRKIPHIMDVRDKSWEETKLGRKRNFRAGRASWNSVAGMKNRVGLILTAQTHALCLAIGKVGGVFEPIRHAARISDRREELGHRGAHPSDETMPLMGIRVNRSHLQLHKLTQR